MRKTLILLIAAGCAQLPFDSTPERTDEVPGRDTGTRRDDDGDGTPNEEDCSPGDAYVHPGAIEVCNTLDDDCDGAVDEGVTSTWYLDSDADGYPGTAVETCEAPPVGEDSPSDCDDADAQVHPTALEECGNERDDDCDGIELRCAISGEIAVASAPTTFYGTIYQKAGYTVAPAGDIDGDGRSDLWVGAWGDGEEEWAGAVYLVPGSASGENVLQSTAIARLDGFEVRQRVGASMAGGDDLDGDGVADSAISGDGAGHDMGRVYLVLGGTTGESSLRGWPDVVTTGGVAAEYMGAVVATSPDLTGDGVGDLIVGSKGTGDDVGAWILAGPFAGERSLDDAVVIGRGAHEDMPGTGVAGVGDLDGDGLADLVVAAYAWSSGGAALVFHGPILEDGSIADANRLIEGEHEDDMLGRNAVGGRGDVDGDGLDDFLAGASWCAVGGEGAGAAYVLSGSATATGTESVGDAAARIYGTSEYGGLGSHHDLADLDNDGRADVLVGVAAGSAPGGGAGNVYVFYGPVVGTLTPADADAVFVGAAEGDNLGTAIANVGDTNLDGVDDVLLGAWGNEAYGSIGGAAYLFR